MSILSIEIRHARAEDASDIARVHDDAWRAAYRGLIPGPELERMVERRGPVWWSNALSRGSRILLMSVGGQVAGYASSGPNRVPTIDAEGEIYELYMAPEYQGLGFGRRLFTASRNALFERGLTGTAVWALAENDGACAFYRAMGGVARARGTETFGSKSLAKIAFVWPSRL